MTEQEKVINSVPLLEIALPRITSRRAIVPAVITHLGALDNNLATNVAYCLKHPQSYAFRAFCRTARDPNIETHLNSHGVEIPLSADTQIFMELGGYKELAQDYLLPPKVDQGYQRRHFDPIIERDPHSSWILIYNRQGIVYIQECAAVQIVDGQSFKDKLHSAVKIKWQNGSNESRIP